MAVVVSADAARESGYRVVQDFGAVVEIKPGGPLDLTTAFRAAATSAGWYGLLNNWQPSTKARQ